MDGSASCDTPVTVLDKKLTEFSDECQKLKIYLTGLCNKCTINLSELNNTQDSAEFRRKYYVLLIRLDSLLANLTDINCSIELSESDGLVSSEDLKLIDIPYLPVSDNGSQRKMFEMEYVDGDSPYSFSLVHVRSDYTERLAEILRRKLTTNSLQNLSQMPIRGDYVIYQEGNQVHRGRVHQVLPHDRLKILDCDTSSLKLVRLQKLYEIDEEVAAIHCQALFCHLLEPVEGDAVWTKDLQNIFSSTLKKCKLSVEIIDKKTKYLTSFLVKIIAEDIDTGKSIDVTEWVSMRILPELRKNISCAELSIYALDAFCEDLETRDDSLSVLFESSQISENDFRTVLKQESTDSSVIRTDIKCVSSQMVEIPVPCDITKVQLPLVENVNTLIRTSEKSESPQIIEAPCDIIEEKQSESSLVETEASLLEQLEYCPLKSNEVNGKNQHNVDHERKILHNIEEQVSNSCNEVKLENVHTTKNSATNFNSFGSTNSNAIGRPIQWSNGISSPAAAFTGTNLVSKVNSFPCYPVPYGPRYCPIPISQPVFQNFVSSPMHFQFPQPVPVRMPQNSYATLPSNQFPTYQNPPVSRPQQYELQFPLQNSSIVEKPKENLNGYQNGNNVSYKPSVCNNDGDLRSEVSEADDYHSASSNTTSLPESRSAQSFENSPTVNLELKQQISILKPNEEMLAVVSYIVSPSEFYIHIANKNNSEMDTLEEELENYYSRTDVNTTFRATYKTKYCACRFPPEHVNDDFICSPFGSWFRAEVMNANVNGAIVFLVDYGKTLFVDTENLRPLAPQFFRLYKMAQRCHLANVNFDRQKEYSTQVNDYFKSLFTVDNNYKIQVIPNARTDRNSLAIIISNYQSPKSITNSSVEKMPDINCQLQAFIEDKEAEYVNYQNGEELWDPMKSDFESIRNNYQLDDEDACIAVSGYNPKDEERICKYFNRDGYCHKINCRWEHVRVHPEKFTTDKTGVYQNAFNKIKLPHQGEVKLKVTCVTSGTTFYTQLSDNTNNQNIGSEDEVEDEELEETLLSLTDAMMDPENVKHYKMLDQLPTIGEIVLAQSSSSDYWYRARVININEFEGTCLVYYPDFGSDEMVKLNCLRVIEPRFLHFPFQAIECYIAELEVNDMNKAHTILETTLGDKIITADVFESFEGRHLLHLVNVFANGDDIVQQLVDTGYYFRKSPRKVGNDGNCLPG